MSQPRRRRSIAWCVRSFCSVSGAVAAVVLLTGCNKAPESPAPGSSSDSSASIVGKRIAFGQGGNSERFRVSGWSDTEREFTWSQGTAARLELPIGSDGGPWTLKLAMAGLIHEPDLPFQPVEVYANDKKIAEWQVGNTAEVAATIPEDVNKAGGKLSLEFRTPKATSPKALGQNQDSRVLGICVRWLELASSK
jgi:hypothetical protein